MKPVEIVVSRTVRVNLGDYESSDFFVSMKAAIEDGEKPRVVSRMLRRVVDRAIVENIQAHFRGRGKPRTPQQICTRYGFSMEGN